MLTEGVEVDEHGNVIREYINIIEDGATVAVKENSHYYVGLFHKAKETKCK